MAANISGYSNVLKEFYEAPIRDAINSTVVAFKTLDETDRQWSGKYVTFPIHKSRNNGVGARAEDGALPDAGAQGFDAVQISATYQYGRIKISGPVMEAGKTAFADALDSELRFLVKDLVNDLGRQSHGFGDGRMAQVGTQAVSACAITVYNRFAEPGQPGARYVFVGQSFDVGTVASPTALVSSKVVKTIAISSNPATTTDSINISDSTLNGSQCESYIFNRGAGGTGVEMHGINALVDDYTQANMWSSNAFFGATLHGINRSTSTYWNSIILANSGVERIVTPYLLQTAFDKVDTESGMEVDIIWGHHTCITAFQEAVAGDRRYNSPVFDVRGDKITFNGVALVKDRQAAYNQLLLMNRSALKLYTLSDFKWADDDGAVLNKVSGYDQYEAFYRAYKNIGLDDAPKKALIIRDIKVDF